MQLDEFVHQTLTQICQGIAAAQKDCAPLGAYINPSVVEKTTTGNFVPSTPSRYSSSRYVQVVNIEASLTDSTSDSHGGSAGLSVSFAKGGYAGGHSDEVSSVNRVSFAVPVVFPSVDVPDVN